MKFSCFRCPITHSELTLAIEEGTENDIVKGTLTNTSGHAYLIEANIPNLVYPELLADSDAESKLWYDNNADTYDENLPLTFKTFDVDENRIRDSMIDKLGVRPGHKILETGAGTGRDTEVILNRLGNSGELHAHDITPSILKHAVSKLHSEDNVMFGLSNASYLPYPDNYFDAYYHFGGFNTFSDKSRAFAEISRVVKVGGRVVVGDESMPPWQRDTDFGKILMNSNPHYRYELPLQHMHPSARDVQLEWIIGGVFYLLSYSVGDGEPSADFDFEIPGVRGGTHNTRYFGHLEGITPQAIELARKAREKTGKSMHKWLDDAIKSAAQKDIG